MASISVLGVLYSILSKIFFDSTPQGWTSTTFAIFFMGGVQLVMLSVVGSYIGRIYTEVQQRPLYVLRESNL
jgi:dolichol-phosphate mannosyltransferase